MTTPAVEPTAKPTPAPAGVLVVDDHAAARRSVADVLSLAGHTVHACSSGHVLLELASKFVRAKQ